MTQEKISREEVQKYCDDYWDILSKEEQTLAINEGFHPPRKAEVIHVDFISGLGEIGRET